MQAQFVVVFVVMVFVTAYAAAERYVRTAKHRDAVRVARGGGRPVVPRPREPYRDDPYRGEPYREVDRPDEKPEERHEPRPVGTR